MGRVRGFIAEGETAEIAEGRFAEAVREIAAYARPKGVDLILEPVNRYEINFINSVDEGAALMERLAIPGAQAHAGRLPHEHRGRLDRGQPHRSTSPTSPTFTSPTATAWRPGWGHLDFRLDRGRAARRSATRAGRRWRSCPSRTRTPPRARRSSTCGSSFRRRSEPKSATDVVGHKTHKKHRMDLQGAESKVRDLCALCVLWLNSEPGVLLMAGSAAEQFPRFGDKSGGRHGLQDDPDRQRPRRVRPGPPHPEVPGREGHPGGARGLLFGRDRPLSATTRPRWPAPSRAARSSAAS